MQKYILIVVIFFTFVSYSFSQNNDNIREVGKKITSKESLINSKNKYPDFAFEINIGTNYTQLLQTEKLTDAITGKGGLFNLDGSLGFKLRLIKKFYLGFGYGYWENSLSQSYKATTEYNNDTSKVYDIKEEGKVCNKGVYVYIGREKEKIFYRLGFSAGLVTEYKGDRSFYDNDQMISKIKITPENYLLTDKYLRDFRLILKFGYSMKLRRNFIIKPYVSTTYSLSPVYHTRYFITKSNGNTKELNMHFATISFGVSFDLAIKKQ